MNLKAILIGIAKNAGTVLGAVGAVGPAAIVSTIVTGAENIIELVKSHADGSAAVDGLTAEDVIAHVAAAKAEAALLVTEAQASLDSRAGDKSPD